MYQIKQRLSALQQAAKFSTSKPPKNPKNYPISQLRDSRLMRLIAQIWLQLQRSSVKNGANSEFKLM